MHCPRCGTENQEGDRFCTNCGGALKEPAAKPERRSPRERIAGLIGSTRRARLLTAGTALALVAAVIAFLALNEDADEEADYRSAVDAMCVSSKEEIGAASRQPATYIENVVTVVGEWRIELQKLAVPSDLLDKANALDESLRDVQVGAAALVEATRRRAADAPARAKRVDDATSEVEKAIAGLDLKQCERVAITPGAAPAPG